MEVLVRNKQNRQTISLKEIRKKATTVLSALGCGDVELSIVIVDDLQITKLNRTYLGRSGPTNVIAFPMQEGPFGEVNPGLLGDVVISLDTAAREAQDARMPLSTRFDQLLIHGILHLLGFDHEKTPEEAEKMRVKEEELFKCLNPCGALGSNIKGGT